MKRQVLFAAFAFLLFAGFANALEQRRIVAAAISLKAPVSEILAQFTFPGGPEIRTNFAASGTILNQLLMGAPISVVIFADKKTMDEAAGKNLVVKESVAEFAENGIMLAARRPFFSGGGVSALASSKGIRRIALGNPDYVPLGRYVKDALAKRGEWELVQPRLILTANAEQTLAYLLTGEVEAAFIFSTDARKLQAGEYFIENLSGVETPKYYIGIAESFAGDRETAELARHLVGADAARTLLQMGFGVPGKGGK